MVGHERKASKNFLLQYQYLYIVVNVLCIYFQVETTVQEVVVAAESEDDPLEGPSWWYSELGSRKTRSSGHKRGRGRGSRLSKPPEQRSSPWEIHIHLPDSSSDSEQDTSVVKKSKLSVGRSDTPVKEVGEGSPTMTLDQSYLPSPATMLARLEDLEARRGRRSKHKSKGQSLKRDSETSLNNQRRLTRKSQELAKKTDEDGGAEEAIDSLNLQPDEAVKNAAEEAVTETQPKYLPFKVPTSVFLPSTPLDFLITDNDLTCIQNTSMDMTEPISKVIRITAAIAKNQEEVEESQPEKRFFKNQLTGPSKANTKVPERTPFDLSMMDATAVDITPYISCKTVEKENLNPQLNPDCDNETQSRHVNLRRVSIVLKDVMKSPDSINKNTLELATHCSASSGSEKLGSGSGREERRGRRRTTRGHQKSIVESPLKKQSVKRKTLKFSIPSPEVEDDYDKDEQWMPSGGKKRRNSKRSTEPCKKEKHKTAGARKRFPLAEGVTKLPLKMQRRRKKSISYNEMDDDCEDGDVADYHESRLPEDKEVDYTFTQQMHSGDANAFKPAKTRQRCKKKSNRDYKIILINFDDDCEAKEVKDSHESKLSEDKEVDCSSTVKQMHSGDANVSISDCYVKVHRTSMKSINDSTSNLEDGFELEIDDPSTDYSPIPQLRPPTDAEEVQSNQVNLSNAYGKFRL